MSWTACSVTGVPMLSRWCFTVLQSKDRLEMIPNGILVNLYTCRLVSTDAFTMSFTHRNLVTSLSASFSPTWRNAFSISAIHAIRLVQNLMSSPHKSSRLTSPLHKHSFRGDFSCSLKRHPKLSVPLYWRLMRWLQRDVEYRASWCHL